MSASWSPDRIKPDQHRPDFPSPVFASIERAAQPDCTVDALQAGVRRARSRSAKRCRPGHVHMTRPSRGAGGVAVIAAGHSAPSPECLRGSSSCSSGRARRGVLTVRRYGSAWGTYGVSDSHDGRSNWSAVRSARGRNLVST